MKMSEEDYSTVLIQAFGRDEKGTLGERYIAEAAYELGLERAPEGYVLVPVDLIAAFKHQRQCDEEGIEIAVSRQAVCELLDMIAATKAGKE